jgi:hypothetical protein
LNLVPLRLSQRCLCGHRFGSRLRRQLAAVRPCCWYSHEPNQASE